MSSASSVGYQIMLWKWLSRVQQEMKHGTPQTQDVAIAALHDQFTQSVVVSYPAFVYPILREVYGFYCQHVLPALNLSNADFAVVRTAFEQTLAALPAQEQIVCNIETHVKTFLQQLKAGAFASIADCVTALDEALISLCTHSHALRENEGSGRSASIAAERQTLRSDAERRNEKELEQHYHTLLKSPFTNTHVRPFFEALLAKLTPEHAAAFASINDLFWHQLNDLLQMPAVLVNTTTRTALLTRLDITTMLTAQGLDTLEFASRVDDRMYQSCWQAVQAARTYLQERFPDVLKDQALHVICRFPNPAAEYNDTSVSLLVGLKVIGDVLDLEIDPYTVVTGELTESGQVRPVSGIAEKLVAVENNPEMQRFMLPAERTGLMDRRVALVPVQTFADALDQYYSERLQQKLRQVSRRQFLKGDLALAVVPFVPVVFSVFKNLFTNPVTEHDWRLLQCAEELYQKKSDYQNAIVIFQSILERFRRTFVTPEVIQLKAETFSHLGRIYIQQAHFDKGLQAYRQAFDLWKTIRHRERQIDILLYSGIAYSEAVTEHSKYGKMILNYYHQANELLKPSMETFTRLQGNIALWTGVFYHQIHQNKTARKYVEQSIAYFHDAASHWNYQIARHHFGNILISLGQFDEASAIFQQASVLPLLQNPFNQAKTLTGLSAVSFALGHTEQGLHYAEQTQKLCIAFGLWIEMQNLQMLLADHHLGLSA